MQQLYQTFIDYDIRFYIYEVLKVWCSFWFCWCEIIFYAITLTAVHLWCSQSRMWSAQ